MNWIFNPKKSFTRDQLIFIVEVMVASTHDLISCSIPGRWMGNEHRKQQSLRQWVKDNNLPNVKTREVVVNHAIWQLGWNLSILYAQLSSDGISEYEALTVMEFQHPLEEWVSKWVVGEIGIIPNGPNTGTESYPELNIPAGVDKLFGPYLEKKDADTETN